MPNVWLEYDPCELICQSHNVKFVKFECSWFKYRYRNISHGCPVCVGLIRAKVQLEINRNFIGGADGRRIHKYKGSRMAKHAPLTSVELEAIMKDLRNGVKQAAIAADYNIATSTVSKILKKYGGDNERIKKVKDVERIIATRVGVTVA